MNDDDSDWMLWDEAVTYVEATVKCYRERARDLLHVAADHQIVRSRTVRSSPTWLVSNYAGMEVFHSDEGEALILHRQDVIKFCTDLQKKQSQPTLKKTRRRPRSDGICLAISALWPGRIPDLKGKERDRQIFKWLQDNGHIPVSNGINASFSRSVQRVLEKH